MPKYKSYELFTRPVTVPLLNGDLLTIHYCPARYSNTFNKGITASGAGGRSNQDFIFHMVGGDIPSEKDKEKSKPEKPVVGWWDWTDEQDKPIPITLEWLAERVNLTDQTAIVNAIVGDLFPNDETATEETTETPTTEASPSNAS
jgi:hypothetical protein